jgi:hypothetical protein
MSSQQAPISIRLDEEIVYDIDAYKASDPLRYRGSRSRAMYDLLSMALYDNDQMPAHLTKRFSQRTTNIMLLLTCCSLFLSVVAMNFYINGTLSAQGLSIFLSVSFLLTAFILGEELIRRIR